MELCAHSCIRILCTNLYSSPLYPDTTASPPTPVMETSDSHTLSVLQQIAHTVTPMISWTTDVPSRYNDCSVPCLDLKISKHESDVNNKIHFEYYRKPVSRQSLVTSESALPTSSKLSILTAEGCRRLSNTIPCVLTEEKKREILRDFNFWLKKSGHSYQF